MEKKEELPIHIKEELEWDDVNVKEELNFEFEVSSKNFKVESNDYNDLTIEQDTQLQNIDKINHIKVEIDSNDDQMNGINVLSSPHQNSKLFCTSTDNDGCCSPVDDLKFEIYEDIKDETEDRKVKETKQKWTRIRDKYGRELQKQKSKSGGSSKQSSLWPYFTVVHSFLHSLTLPNITIGNLTNFGNEQINETHKDKFDQNVESAENAQMTIGLDESIEILSEPINEKIDNLSPNPPIKPVKRKRPNVEEMINLLREMRTKSQKMDDCEMFLLSLAPLLKFVPPENQLNTRIKLLSVFTENN